MHFTPGKNVLYIVPSWLLIRNFPIPKDSKLDFRLSGVMRIKDNSNEYEDSYSVE